jgi:hypothetical protein
VSNPSGQAHPSPPLPRWVDALDVLAIGAVCIAVLAALGGSVRLNLGALRLTMSSPLRPLIAAVVIIVIRHAIIPERPLHDRVSTLLGRLQAIDGWGAAWHPFVATRAAILTVGLLAVYTVGYPPGAPPYRVARSEVINLPMRWDAGWYMGIATSGYRWDPSTPDRQQNVAFFPGYPLLTWVAGRAFGNSLVAFLVAGVTVSHAAFLWSLVYLYRLAREQLGDGTAATRAVVLLASYPFSVFHGAVYTESLFLLGCLGAILNFKRERLLRATAWGILVGLSRPNGFLLSATLLALAYTLRVRVDVTNPRAHLVRLLAIAAPVIGTVIFSCYVAVLTGNPLQWSAQHAAWGRVYRGASPFLDPVVLVGRYGFESYLARLPYDAMNAAAAAFALALILPVWRRLGLPYAVFLGVNLLPPLLLGGVMSMGRLTSTMFPLFVWLGSRSKPESVAFWVVIFAVGQSLGAVLFYTWRPLY